MRIAATALGVATAKDLRDYFRMAPRDGQRAIDALVAAGDLVPADVEGWRHPAYLDAHARIPRRIEARALLAPFDPLIWERRAPSGCSVSAIGWRSTPRTATRSWLLRAAVPAQRSAGRPRRPQGGSRQRRVACPRGLWRG